MTDSGEAAKGVIDWKKLFFLSAVIIVLDQLTKYLASGFLHYRVPVEVFPMFNLTLAHNTGAAFSFLADAGGWQRYFFSGVSLVVSIILVVWITRLKPHEKLLGVALALILGGAVGNLYDRAVHGYVVDFLDVYWGAYHWPAFNIADSAICIGAGLMLLEMFVGPKDAR